MSVPFRFGFRLLQFVFPLLLMFFFAGRADAYSCGDPSKNHCYGVTTWTQGTEYFGAYADITQVQMACPSGCGGFVDDEIWLIDTSSANCLTNQFQMCWVEAGTTANEGSSPTYFWADGRPGTGNKR